MPPTIPQSMMRGFVINQPGRQVTPEEAFAEFLLDLRQQMKRQAQNAYDFSHPVDEYQSGPGTFTPPLEIQPTYALFSERIESAVVAGFSPNATGVVLQLGDRFIPIDVTRGAATGGIIVLDDIGIVLKAHERRLLNVATFGNTVAQPAVPASGVAVQNLANVPVTVVLSGFTATQVIVNGIVVGVSNGTYVVPALGSISVTYTVAGTWTWTPPQYNGYFVGLFGHASDVFETVLCPGIPFFITTYIRTYISRYGLIS